MVIVSGLPRSGTSLMMAMLQAGGLSLLVDGIKKADEDNPRGYFELEKVKQLKKDTSWLKDAQGKGMKTISALLEFLPPDYEYRLIFMDRDLREILASQKEMLLRRGEKKPTPAEDKRMEVFFQKHLKKVKNWLKKQPNMKVLEVNHREVINHPLKAAKMVNQFLGGQLGVERMAGVVDKKLYRQRI